MDTRSTLSWIVIVLRPVVLVKFLLVDEEEVDRLSMEDAPCKSRWWPWGRGSGGGGKLLISLGAAGACPFPQKSTCSELEVFQSRHHFHEDQRAKVQYRLS